MFARFSALLLSLAFVSALQILVGDVNKDAASVSISFVNEEGDPTKVDLVLLNEDSTHVVHYPNITTSSTPTLTLIIHNCFTHGCRKLVRSSETEGSVGAYHFVATMVGNHSAEYASSDKFTIN